MLPTTGRYQAAILPDHSPPPGVIRPAVHVVVILASSAGGMLVGKVVTPLFVGYVSGAGALVGAEVGWLVGGGRLTEGY